MKRLLTAVLFLAPMTLAFAQDMAPPKEITALGWMVGTWSGSGKIAFGGNQTPITTTMKVSIDGQFLKTISTDKSDQYTLTKTTMTGWDSGKSEYVSYTFTNMAPKARIAHGKIEGGKLVMISDPWEAEGFTTVMRESTSKVSDTSYNYELEMKMGEKWDTGMDFFLKKQ